MEESYEVRNREVEEKIREIGQALKNTMPEGWGFVLTLASYGEGGATFYMSSIERDDTIKLLEEMIEKLKRRRANAG